MSPQKRRRQSEQFVDTPTEEDRSGWHVVATEACPSFIVRVLLQTDAMAVTPGAMLMTSISITLLSADCSMQSCGG